MADIDMKQENGLVYARISRALQAEDFKNTIAPAVQAMLKRGKPFSGVFLDATHFEGWADFPAFVRHMEFIRDNHAAIRKVAITGSGPWRDILPQVAEMIEGLRLQIFDTGQDDVAKSWLLSA